MLGRLVTAIAHTRRTCLTCLTCLACSACLASLALVSLPAEARQTSEVSPARMELAAIPSWVEGGSRVDVDLRIEPVTPDLELTVRVHRGLATRTAFERTLEEGGSGPTLGSATYAVDELEPGPVGTHRVTLALGPPPEPRGTDDQEGSDDSAGEGGAGDDAPAPFVAVDEQGVYPLELELRVAGAEATTDTLSTHLVVFDEDDPPARLSVGWVWPIGVDAPRDATGTVSDDLSDAVAPAGRIAHFTDALGTAPDVPVTLAPSAATVEAWSDLASRTLGGTTPSGDPERHGTTPWGDPERHGTTAGAEGGSDTEGGGDTESRTDSDTDADDESTTSRGTEETTALAARGRLKALRTAAGREIHQIVSGTYARADPTALVAAGLEDELATQLARAQDVLREVLQIRPDPRVYVADRLDEAALGTLRRAGVDRIVLRRNVLEPVFTNLTLARPFEIRSRGRSVNAALADPGLAESLERDEAGSRGNAVSDAAVAHRFLAGLAMIAVESPSEERGVVVAPPPEWRPTANTLVTVLRGLVDHPALRPVSLDTFFEEVEPIEGDPARRRLDETTPGRLAIGAETVRTTRAHLAALETMLPEDSPEITRGEQLVLLAESKPAQTPGASPSAADYARAARGLVDDVLASVRLPQNHTVTLTASEGRIPITFVNQSARPLRVRIHLESEKLRFPAGDTHELTLPPRSTTTQFTVEARTSGTFPLQVQVTSPDSRLEVGSFRMTIRSTAVSEVALAVTVGAGVFLVGWWGNHFRHRRRRRREEQAAEAELAAQRRSGGPAGPDEPGPPPPPGLP